MEVAVQFSKAMRAIAMVINPDVSIADATKHFTDTADAPVRAHVVSKARLSRAVMRMGLRISELYAAASRRRLDISHWVAEAEAAASAVAHARAEVIKILAERDRYLIDGLSDARLWDALTSNLEFQEGQRDLYAGQQNEAHKRVLALVLDAGQEFVGQLQDTGPIWAEVISAMREELGHSFDDQTFLRLHNQIVDAGAANVHALRAVIDAGEPQ